MRSLSRRQFLLFPLAGRLGGGSGYPVPGSVLVHEHVLVDFIGADQIQPGRYDPEDVIRVAVPKLQELKRWGACRLLECTPAWLGRDPRLLRRLEEITGLELWTNTGIYGAGNHRYVPSFVRNLSAEQLARLYIREFEQGVEGVKPRFIKTGVNRAPLNELDRKLIRAAALACRETGLTIASHTPDGPAAMEQLEWIDREQVPVNKFVWVHAQNERDHGYHRKVAELGAWVEFDGISEKSLDWHLECVRVMAQAGLLHRTLISQDAGWYHVGEPGGGNYRGYTFIYTDFLPRLEQGWAEQLLVVNPRRAFGT